LRLVDGQDAQDKASIDLRRIEELPTLPEVAARVLQVVRDARSSAKDVEAIVVRDPVLSAKILRVANSAFYGFTQKITTVGHAIAILGFNQILSLLLSITMFDKFRTRRMDLQGFWRHSIATATGAKFLARQARLSVEESFMAGLLHDIGKLAFAFLWEGAYFDVLRLQHSDAISSCEAETRLLHCSHTSAGSAMAENWSLPPDYVQVIRHHHAPTQAAETHRALCALVHVANFAAHEVFPSLFAHVWDETKLEEAQSLAQLPSDAFDQCVAHLKEQEEGINTFLTAIQ
jgi:putative nucleotidyltransferase with HDIG domain